MEHHQLLFKANHSLLGEKVCKRKTANNIRSSKRSDLYSSTRKLSLSPSPKKNTYCAEEEQKENFKPPNPVAPLKQQEKPTNTKECEVPSSSSSSVSSSEVKNVHLPAKISEKQSRQKAHLLRFLAWKTEKARQAELKIQSSKRPPFVVPCRVAGSVESENIAKKSFAPKDHTFHAPEDIQIVGANSIQCIYDNQKVTYHYRSTPKKKNPNESKVTSIKPQPAPKPLFLRQAAISAEAVTKMKATLTSDPKPRIPNVGIKKTTPSVTRPTPSVTRPTPSVTKPTPSVTKPPPSVTKPPPSVTRPTSVTKPTPSITRPIPSAMRPTPSATKPTPSFKAPTHPRPTSKPSKPLMKPPPPLIQQIKKKSNQENLKAIAPSQRVLKIAGKSKNLSGINKSKKTSAAISKIKLNGNYIKQSITSGLVKSCDPVPETPTDTNPDTPFLKVVTSTKRRSFSTKESSANSLLLEMEKIISPFEDSSSIPGDKGSKSDKKFNFLHFSVVESEDKPEEDNLEKEKPKTPTEEVQVTPDRTAGPTPPTTYLSPYVSVSRGKVGIKVEREKRNSLYMPMGQTTENHETAAIERKTLATVHYYRKQLSDEIDRLDEQCRVWEQYKASNVQFIEDSGIDMINVTIGQTRLLTTKKLKQFGDLIDRCENGVLGKNTSCKDGGDDAKPILAEDLEGFWSMVGLQIENVDKRFANLQRWKENSWKDPDELPSKATNSGVVVKKTKKRKAANTAGPNIALQKMLRNAHAAYLRKKTDSGGVDEDVILTPSKSRQVLIKDRRSRSAAPTIITVNTPRINRKSLAIDQTTPTGVIPEPKISSHRNIFRKSLILFQNSFQNGQDKKSSPSVDFNASLAGSSRKSILKTPGSKCRPKSVIFNSPAIKFTIEEPVVESAKPRRSWTEEEEEEEERRTYSLRTRNVVLRDSAEIIIPR